MPEVAVGVAVDEVGVGVTRHEQAADTLEARPPQFETKVKRAAVAEMAVKVRQD